MSRVPARMSVVCMILLGAPKAWATTVDFTAGWPAGATYSSDMGTTGGGVGITNFSALSSNYLDGHVDISYGSGTLSTIAGQEVTLLVVRANSVDDGNFEANDLGTGGASWQSSGATNATTTFSSGYGAQLSVAASSSTDAYIQQWFPTQPGDVYRVSYTTKMGSYLPAWSPSAGTYGSLEVRARAAATSTGGSAITPKRPTTGYTGSAINTTGSVLYELIARHTSALGTKRVTKPFAVPDCDDHTVYDDGTTTLTFTRHTPTTTCASEIQYGGITFLADAQSPSSATNIQIDDVMVDWIRQIEVEILDNDSLGTTSTVLQSTTVDTGFYVNDYNTTDHPYGVTMRIWARTHESGVTPILKKIFIDPALPVDVTVGSQVASFSADRLGVDMHVPPRSEFDSYSGPMSTECYDPVGATYEDCYALFADYGLTNVRMFLWPSSFDYTWNAGTGDYDVTPNATGQDFMSRIADANAAGLDPLLLLPVHGTPDTDMSFWNGTCTDVYYDDLVTFRSNQDQSRHLFDLFALAALNGLDGTQSDYSYAEVDDFEILNEPNDDASFPQCTSYISDTDLPDLTEEVAEAMDAGSTRASYNVSFGGLEPGDFYPAYDTDYLSGDLLPALNPAYFTNSNFHPYVKVWSPEELYYRYTPLAGILSSFGWGSTSPWFTEYAYKRNSYDPGCTGSEWITRGYGDTEQARLMARATVSALNTPAEKIMAWGQMSNELISGSVDPCWEALTSNKVMFERVPGTGTAFGGSGDAQYVPNDAGNAFLGLGEYLSESSPYSVSSPSLTMPSGWSGGMDGERYYVQVYAIPTGYAAVLWWYREYNFGEVHKELGEESQISYQNLLYDEADVCDDGSGVACGTNDYGFRGARIHNLRFYGISDASTLDTVTMVPLDGSFDESPLAWHYDASPNAFRVDLVVAGEMPVIILMEDLY